MSSGINFGCDIKALQATVTGSAARLVAVPAGGGRPRANGGLAVKALAANTQTVWLGGSDVTTSLGYPLAAGESIAIACDDPSRVWALSTSGSQTVAIIYL